MLENEHVCSNCFSDSGIMQFITDNAEARTCSFCGRRSRRLIAARLERVTEHIDGCLRREYEDAANCLPYETAEGGFQGHT